MQMEFPRRHRKEDLLRNSLKRAPVFFQSVSINLGRFLHLLAQQDIPGFYPVLTAPALGSAISVRSCGAFFGGDGIAEQKSS